MKVLEGRKKFFLGLIFFLFIFAFVFTINVQSLEPPAEERLRPPTRWQSLEEIFRDFTDFIYYLALSLAVLVFLIGAFHLITSAGDPVKVRQAKNIIMYAIIGLIIIFFASGIFHLIRNLLRARQQ